MRSLVVWIGLAVVAGCRGPGIQGAVYAGQVPVYPGARFVSTTHGSYTDSAGRPPSLVTESWFFSYQDSSPRVVDYYQRQLVGARREDDEDAVTFTFVPKGAEPGENVSVTIRRAELQIGETTKPGKRKAGA